MSVIRFLLGWFGAVLLTLALTLAAGPQPKGGDAAIEKVVADSLEAAKKSAWAAYAELVRPESLKQYKNMWLPVLKSAANDDPEKQAELLRLFDKAADLKSVIAL